MESVQFLQVPENREAVLTLSRNALVKLNPDEAGITARFIDPLIEMAARDQIIERVGSNKEGSFNEPQLMVMVVVPIIVEVVRELLNGGTKRFRDRLTEVIKKDGKGEKRIRLVTYEQIKPVIDRAGFPKTRREIRLLVDIINQVLEEYEAES